MKFLKRFGISLLVFFFFVLLNSRYLHHEREQLYKDAEELQIVAAATNLAKGTVLKFDDIGLIRIYRHRGGYTKHYILKPDAYMILGHKLRFDLEPRQPILWADLDLPEGVHPSPPDLSSLASP